MVVIASDTSSTGLAVFRSDRLFDVTNCAIAPFNNKIAVFVPGF